MPTDYSLLRRVVGPTEKETQQNKAYKLNSTVDEMTFNGRRRLFRAALAVFHLLLEGEAVVEVRMRWAELEVRKVENQVQFDSKLAYTFGDDRKNYLRAAMLAWQLIQIVAGVLSEKEAWFFSQLTCVDSVKSSLIKDAQLAVALRW